MVTTIVISPYTPVGSPQSGVWLEEDTFISNGHAEESLFLFFLIHLKPKLVIFLWPGIKTQRDHSIQPCNWNQSRAGDEAARKGKSKGHGAFDPSTTTSACIVNGEPVPTVDLISFLIIQSGFNAHKTLSKFRTEHGSLPETFTDQVASNYVFWGLDASSDT